MLSASSRSFFGVNRKCDLQINFSNSTPHQIQEIIATIRGKNTSGSVISHARIAHGRMSPHEISRFSATLDNTSCDGLTAVEIETERTVTVESGTNRVHAGNPFGGNEVSQVANITLAAVYTAAASTSQTSTTAAVATPAPVQRATTPSAPLAAPPTSPPARTGGPSWNSDGIYNMVTDTNPVEDFLRNLTARSINTTFGPRPTTARILIHNNIIYRPALVIAGRQFGAEIPGYDGFWMPSLTLEENVRLQRGSINIATTGKISEAPYCLTAVETDADHASANNSASFFIWQTRICVTQNPSRLELETKNFNANRRDEVLRRSHLGNRCITTEYSPILSDNSRFANFCFHDYSGAPQDAARWVGVRTASTAGVTAPSGSTSSPSQSTGASIAPPPPAASAPSRMPAVPTPQAPSTANRSSQDGPSNWVGGVGIAAILRSISNASGSCDLNFEFQSNFSQNITATLRIMAVDVANVPITSLPHDVDFLPNKTARITSRISRQCSEVRGFSAEYRAVMVNDIITTTLTSEANRGTQISLVSAVTAGARVALSTYAPPSRPSAPQFNPQPARPNVSRNSQSYRICETYQGMMQHHILNLVQQGVPLNSAFRSVERLSWGTDFMMASVATAYRDPEGMRQMLQDGRWIELCTERLMGR